MVRAVRTRVQGASLIQKIRHMKVDLFLDLLMPIAFFLSAVLLLCVSNEDYGVLFFAK